jgi:hypothetical protein
VDHFESFNQLQNVVGKYVTQYNLVVAAGPVTATTLVKTFITDNKAVKVAMVGSGVWLAVKELSGPMLGLIQDQFGSLDAIFSSFGR